MLPSAGLFPNRPNPRSKSYLPRPDPCSISRTRGLYSAYLGRIPMVYCDYRIVRSIGEECIQEDELMNLLAKKPNPICYDGFEPYGRMHILVSAGCKVKIWVADWFAQLNNKMGGDLKKIGTATGMNLDGVDFLWSSEEINSRAHEYWSLVMDISRKNKLPRIMRCCQIMGRREQDELTTAQIFYPCLQCADIFFLKADSCQLGMDQRKVNVLAREYCDDIKRKNKSTILSHHMLPALQQGQEKMSKSDPSSSIFMEDEEAEVSVKIKKAYCPPKVVIGNPCLEYVKYITFLTYEDPVADYEKEELHPADLQPSFSKSLNTILQPMRDHFKNNPTASELSKSYRH
ncbi:tyrosine--tRNA ligase [Ranunculus cassubicifolius]